MGYGVSLLLAYAPAQKNSMGCVLERQPALSARNDGREISLGIARWSVARGAAVEAVSNRARGACATPASSPAGEAADYSHDDRDDTLKPISDCGDGAGVERTLMMALQTAAIALTTAMMQPPMAPKMFSICRKACQYRGVHHHRLGMVTYAGDDGTHIVGCCLMSTGRRLRNSVSGCRLIAGGRSQCSLC